MAALSTSSSTRTAQARRRDSVTSVEILATCPDTVPRTPEAEAVVEEDLAAEVGEDSAAEAGEAAAFRAEEVEGVVDPSVAAGGVAEGGSRRRWIV